ncbi:MAG: hypothetical protein H6901_01545 [Rhodobacteraceae bacterium]|nr:hypothetical protein [Paracoccaceae bacterium]
MTSKAPVADTAEDMFRRAAEHRNMAGTLHRAGIKALEERYGLVPEVTRVRQGDLEGFFLESLNYDYDERRLWIRVRLDPPLPERYGTFRKFYHDWQVV